MGCCILLLQQPTIVNVSNPAAIVLIPGSLDEVGEDGGGVFLLWGSTLPLTAFVTPSEAESSPHL